MQSPKKPLAHCQKLQYNESEAPHASPFTITAFGAITQPNQDLYEGYYAGGEWGAPRYVTDPAGRDLYTDLVYINGGVGSATASGYGSFYTEMIDGQTGKDYWCGLTSYDKTKTYTKDDIKPMGNIKWVLYDGILVITNDWTEEEVLAASDNGKNWNLMYSMTEFNPLNWGPWYLEFTPFRNNPNIETIILGDNIDCTAYGQVFVGCENVKNIIMLDTALNCFVQGVVPEYVITCPGEIKPSQTVDIDDWANAPRGTGWENDSNYDKVAYPGSNGSTGVGDMNYYAPSKGGVDIGNATYKYELHGTSTYTWPDAETIASQYAQAKTYVQDMDLPDWALAFLPVEMGGTETARTVEEVFDLNTVTLKAGWNDGSNTTVETPVTQPETATSVKYSDWAADDIYHAVDFGYLDAAEDKSRVPAVTDLLGADFTKAITRGQFAALAVRYYETLMTDLAGYDYTIPVNTGDDVFADSTGNEAIAKAFTLGILGGYNSADNRAGIYVGPNDLITREQAATMLTRLMNELVEAFDSVGREGWSVYYADSLPFEDTISDWALDGVRAVYREGVMNGTSGTTFSPKSNYTIEQSVVTIMRIDEWANAGMA